MVKVTVLSGFLGSGKTSLLKHILQNAEGYKVAVLVNDMGAVNIDAEMVKKLGHKMKDSIKGEHMVELSNGCICCTLREEMVNEISKLAAEKDLTHIVIESTGIAEPLPVAAGFTFGVKTGEKDETKPLSDLAQLDTMVTVVDTANFKNYMKNGNMAKKVFPDKSEKGCEAPEEDRGVAELLVDQIEFANTIILNKVDTAGERVVAEVEKIVKSLNSDAKIIKANYCTVPLTEVLDTNRFSFTTAMRHASWAKELQPNQHTPETLEYDLSSFVYSRRLPFHPTRLQSLLTAKTLFNKFNIFRMKGFLWVPNEADLCCHLSCAGPCYELETEGEWFVNLPKERFAEEMQGIGMSEEEFKKSHPNYDDPRHGDRRQEIVVIGQGLDKKAVEAVLDEALVTEEEFAKGDEWLKELPDHFDLGFIHEEVEEDEEDEEEEEEEGDHHHHSGPCSHGKRPREPEPCSAKKKPKKE